MGGRPRLTGSAMTTWRISNNNKLLIISVSLVVTEVARVFIDIRCIIDYSLYFIVLYPATCTHRRTPWRLVSLNAELGSFWLLLIDYFWYVMDPLTLSAKNRSAGLPFYIWPGILIVAVIVPLTACQSKLILNQSERVESVRRSIRWWMPPPWLAGHRCRHEVSKQLLSQLWDRPKQLIASTSQLMS